MSSRVTISSEVLEKLHPYAEAHELSESAAVEKLLLIGVSRWGALRRYAGKPAPPPREKKEAVEKEPKPKREKKAAASNGTPKKRAKAKAGDRRLKGNKGGKTVPLAEGAAAAPDASAEPSEPTPPQPSEDNFDAIDPADPFNDLDPDFGTPPDDEASLHDADTEAAVLGRLVPGEPASDTRA